VTAPRPAAVWATRRARALRLAREVPHAAEILTTYAKLTEVQERVAAEVPVVRWLAAARTHEVGGSGAPLLRIERLPVDELLPLFADCLEQMAGVGTEVMRQEAKRLAADSGERRTLLDHAQSQPDTASFHPRAFVEAVATPLVMAVAADLPADVEPGPAAPTAEGNGTAARCRACGGSPVVATLRDHAGALGARALVCGLCGNEQRIRRLTCAHCGESDAERLRVHTAESVPHVRLDECRSCGRYLKTVDLRRRGDAVPMVEELATVELDLWAREQGLTKMQTNIFGL
jgi:FdhE protein